MNTEQLNDKLKDLEDMSFIKNLSPVNKKEEEAKLSENPNYETNFKYDSERIKPLRLDERIGELEKIRNTVHSSDLSAEEKALYNSKIDGLQDQATLLANLGTDTAVSADRNLYGKDKKTWKYLVKTADEILARKRTAEKPKMETEKVVLPENLKDYYEMMLVEYKSDSAYLIEEGNGVRLDESLSGINFNREQLRIDLTAEHGPNKQLPFSIIQALISMSHEVGHYRGAVNALHHPSDTAKYLFSRGFGEYETTTDGKEKRQQADLLIELAERHPKLITKEQAEEFFYVDRLQMSSRYVKAIEMAMNGDSHSQVYRGLRDLGAAHNRALIESFRAKRGMPGNNGSMMTAKYLLGYTEQKMLQEQGQNLDDLELGAFPIELMLGEDSLIQKTKQSGQITEKPVYAHKKWLNAYDALIYEFS